MKTKLEIRMFLMVIILEIEQTFNKITTQKLASKCY